MSRKRGYQNPNQLQRTQSNKWFNHYMNYLSSLTYQLFEWKNLPDTIDPRYLELSLHNYGYVGFYKDEKLGYIVSQGAASGTLDHYNLPTEYHAVSPTYQKTFKVCNYLDMVGNDGYGTIIWNNDLHFPTMASIELFAQDLAETQAIINVNRNAQKTPVLITANDNTKFSMQNIYNQYEGNAPVIITHETVNPDTIKVFKTDAPFVVDKLRSDRDKIWNEFMTFIGIKNANLEKKERMITAEADSNDEQIEASNNVFLKSRQEACKIINNLYGLDIEVCFRESVIEQIQSNVKEVNDNE